MNKGRGIGFGLFLLTLGILWALANIGVVNWSILNSLYVLWPLILVAVGISIIFHKHWAVRLVTWVVFLAVLVGHSYYYGDRNNNKFDFNLNFGNGVNVTNKTGEVNENNDTDGTNGSSESEFDKPDGLQKANLELALGACEIELGSGTPKLVESKVDVRNVMSSTSFNSDKSSGTVRFENRKHVNLGLSINNKSDNTFILNEDTEWDIAVETGASDCKLDLSKLKVNNFTYEGGVSNLDITFGDKSSSTKAEIETGVSKVNIKVPQTAGVRVTTDKGLSTANFNGDGWIRTDDNEYETDNYEQASCKIEINADIGVSTFNVERVR